MRPISWRYLIVSVVLVLGLGRGASTIYGQAKIELDDGRWVSVGGGLRATFRSSEEPGGSYKNDVDLDNARLYLPTRS